MATRVRQGPYCSHKPLETAGCCKPRGQPVLDLLPADSKGSNKRSMQARKQIWASKQSSLDLLLLCRKTGDLKVFFIKCTTRTKLKSDGSLNAHCSSVTAPKPVPTGPQESPGKNREKNKIHIVLACPWGAGSVYCARQESQALYNRPIKQRLQASSTSKAHTKPHDKKKKPKNSSTGTWKRCPRSKGSTALQLEPRHSNRNFCSWRWPKSNLTLPSKQSPDKRPGTEQPVLSPPLHPRWLSHQNTKAVVQWCPEISENLIPSPTLFTTPSSADSVTFSLQYYLGSVSPCFQSQSPFPFPEPDTALLAPSAISLTYLHLDNYNPSLFSFYWFLRHSFLRCTVSLDYTI